MLFNKYLSEIILCSELFYTWSAWSQVHILRHVKHLKKSGDPMFTKRQQPPHMRAGPGIDWQIWSIGDLPYIRVEMGLFQADE